MTANETAKTIRQEVEADLRKMEDAILDKAAAIIAKRIEDATFNDNETTPLEAFCGQVQAIVQGK
jgi:hypothetical protein